MRFLTTDSETGLKLQSGTPPNGFDRGRELTGAYRLRIKVKSEFDDSITRKKSREQSWEIRSRK